MTVLEPTPGTCGPNRCNLRYVQDWPPASKLPIIEHMDRIDIIHGDRRGDRRYSYEMELQFSYSLRGANYYGSGMTADLSRGAVRFLCDNPPPDGVDVELRIAWPFLLQNVCPLELVVRGTTMKTNERGTILAMNHYEFRTCGQRSFVSAATGAGSSSVLA